MKTATKQKLADIIEKKGPSRPSDLARVLEISPQALHRHLKALVAEGVIEPRGKPPVTQYVIADRPDFEPALRWFQSRHAREDSRVCETRDRFAGRLGDFEGLNIPEGILPLLISASGEIGNNSFDHNMGQWKDIPGCWFQTQSTRNRVWVLIADRGQGIYHSLSRVVPSLADDASAVRKAFEEHLSGRAPEKRGNGLKFVKNLITESADRGIACRSSGGSVDYGAYGADCFNILKALPEQDFGTITLMAWSLK